MLGFKRSEAFNFLVWADSNFCHTKTGRNININFNFFLLYMLHLLNKSLSKNKSLSLCHLSYKLTVFPRIIRPTRIITQLCTYQCLDGEVGGGGTGKGAAFKFFCNFLDKWPTLGLENSSNLIKYPHLGITKPCNDMHKK